MKELNDKQKLFLEVLFTDEVQGDFIKAKKAAGYSDNYATSNFFASKDMKEAILEATRDFLARTAPSAAVAIHSAIVNPVQLGLGHKLAAAKDILDRIGIVKTEKIEVSSPGIFVLPPKDRPGEEV
jgi:hypothetical protein